jgi:hypothetical protein
LENQLGATSIAINIVMIFGFNHLFGCRANSGIILCALTPLVLLAANPWLSVLAIASIALLTYKTNFFFTASEKAALNETCGKGLAKLKRMFS